MKDAPETLTQQAKSHKSFGFGMPPEQEIEFALWQAECCLRLAQELLSKALPGNLLAEHRRGLIDEARRHVAGALA